MSGVGYVVIEWNQASCLPGLACADLYYDREDAQDCADDLRSMTIASGRREGYSVGVVTIEDQP